MTTELVTGLTVLAIAVFIIVLCIKIIIGSARNKKAQKKKMADLKEQGLKYQIVANHVYGLPLPDDLPCTIQVYSDHIDFLTSTTLVALSLDKITDMCIKTETEIQTQYVSSTGGAIAGGLLFGPVGAIIGGRAKAKDKRTNTNYLIIIYKDKEDALAYLCFNVTFCFFKANKIVQDFRQTNPNAGVHIDL